MKVYTGKKYTYRGTYIQMNIYIKRYIHKRGGINMDKYIYGNIYGWEGYIQRNTNMVRYIQKQIYIQERETYTDKHINESANKLGEYIWRDKHMEGYSHGQIYIYRKKTNIDKYINEIIYKQRRYIQREKCIEKYTYRQTYISEYAYGRNDVDDGDIYIKSLYIFLTN